MEQDRNMHRCREVSDTEEAPEQQLDPNPDPMVVPVKVEVEDKVENFTKLRWWMRMRYLLPWNPHANEAWTAFLAENSINRFGVVVSAFVLAAAVVMAACWLVATIVGWKFL
ncbi:MAG: hypothetical protein LBM66_01700 [Bifidobacteriaceae bacterium]|jgi:hypothetical protein|nr:hypothetical protein [Bifidobacteriaceae bacterium]